MTVPAIITAELLVHPAIRYPVTAMKTFRHMPDYFLIVFHPLEFFVKYEDKKPCIKYPWTGFSFSLRKFFCFFKPAALKEKSLCGKNFFYSH